MKVLDNAYIVYDGSCTCCSRLRKTLTAAGATTADDYLPFQGLPEGLRNKLEIDKYRNEIALVDGGDSPTRYGADALLHAIGVRYPAFSWLFRLPGLWMVARSFYKTIGFNRHELTPPLLRPIHCDLVPDLHKGYRVGFWMLCALVAGLLTALAGGAVSRLVPGLSYGEGAVLALAVCGPGWLVQGVWGFLLLRGKKYTEASWPMGWAYASHLAMLMALGTLWLLPTILWDAFLGPVPVGLPIVCVVASFASMSAGHKLRALHLGLPGWWTLLWGITLAASAGAALEIWQPGILKNLF